jgi:hypothetical protein
VHRGASQRGSDTTIDPVICRTLRREYRFFAPDAASRETLRFIETDPIVEDHSLQPLEVRFERRHGFLSGRLPNGAMAEGTARHVLGMLHGMVGWDVRDSHGASPLIHGATVIVNGKRLVIMGQKGSGKTTLVLSLLARGYAVEGDEHLLVNQETVIARPRTLRVKPGSFDLVGPLPFRLADLPAMTGWEGDRTYAIAPHLFGRPWIVRSGPLDALVFIRANHGGHSVAKPLAHDTAFRKLLQNIHFAGVSPLLGSVRLRSLVQRVRSFELRLGDISGAQFHLERIARD